MMDFFPQRPVKCPACGWRGRRVPHCKYCMQYECPAGHCGMVFGTCPKCGAQVEHVMGRRKKEEP